MRPTHRRAQVPQWVRPVALPFASHLWLPVALVALCAPGCSSSNEAADGSGAGGTGGSSDGGPTNVSIAFTTPGPLIYVPGDVLSLGVRVTPEGTYTVRFSLVGESRDAYLDRGETVTAADGTADLNLTAPTSPATFTVRASADGAAATLSASPGTSFGTLEVIPEYAGQRAITTWTATVRTGFECATSGVPPSDGPLRIDAAPGSPLLLGSVPADAPLTVTVRAGHFAGGCAELPSILAGRTTPVTVTVVDRPLQLDTMSLPVSLHLDLTQPVIDVWTTLSASMTAAFTGGASTDAQALLDAMGAALDPASLSTFTTLRTAKGWDTLLSTSTTIGTDGLRTAVTRYVIGGLPPTGSEVLGGTLAASTAQAGTVAITRVLGFSPGSVGVQTPLAVSLSAETDDRVLFGGTATWDPAALAAALALGPATTEVSSAASVTEALVQWAQCSTVATLLVDVGTGFAFGTCDATCVETACKQAVGTMWDRARAIATAGTTVEIAESGRATRVDDAARPLVVEGSWVGTTAVGAAPLTIGGSSLLGTVP